MRCVNCGFRSLKGRLLFFWKAVVSHNPVNKLYSLAYKVQQTFFVPAKKHELSEQHDTCLLLKSHDSY